MQRNFICMLLIEKQNCLEKYANFLKKIIYTGLIK